MIIRGTVVRGKGEGRALGYPTANLDYKGETGLEPGVFAARALVDGNVIRGAAVVGMWRLGSGLPSVEVHLFEPPGDLYGRELTVAFYKKIRGLQSFPGRETLVEQIGKDIEAVERILQSDSITVIPALRLRSG